MWCRRRPRRKHYKPEALLRAGLPLEACLSCAQKGHIALVPIEKIGEHIARKHTARPPKVRRSRIERAQKPVTTTPAHSWPWNW